MEPARPACTPVLLWFALVIGAGWTAQAHAAPRAEIAFPDIPGYVTLKCDFHMHTVFSDGGVWPTVRVEEAWREGLDAFAITDHVEYRREGLPEDMNRPYELVRRRAADYGMIFVNGAEITRPMPPGHMNALFLEDVNALKADRWQDAVAGAIGQAALVFWNHPGRKGEHPGGVIRWYPEHDTLLAQGRLHGIEIVNGDEYYPEAHRWCLEKGLTMISGSDLHNPASMDIDLSAGEHRPITLVFARERTAASVREALREHRTAVYWGNRLAGQESYLRPICELSMEVLDPEIILTGTGRAVLRVRNHSSVDFELVAEGTSDLVQVPDEITLEAGKTEAVWIRGRQADRKGEQEVELAYRARNLLIEPDTGLPVTLAFRVRFQPAAEGK